MAEAMSEERLAVCRDLPRLIRRHAWMAAEDAADAIRDLAAEVDRLHAHLVAEHLATEAAETENDRLRAQLAGIGETPEADQGPCFDAVSIGAMPYACIRPKGHGGDHNRVMWYSPGWQAEADRAARFAEREVPDA